MQYKDSKGRIDHLTSLGVPHRVYLSPECLNTFRFRAVATMADGSEELCDRFRIYPDNHGHTDRTDDLGIVSYSRLSVNPRGLIIVVDIETGEEKNLSKRYDKYVANRVGYDNSFRIPDEGCRVDFMRPYGYNVSDLKVSTTPADIFPARVLEAHLLEDKRIYYVFVLPRSEEVKSIAKALDTMLGEAVSNE